MASLETKKKKTGVSEEPMILFFDVEATGFVARTDESTQIGSVLLDPTTNVTHEFTHYVKPLTRRVHPSAVAVTGLTNDFLSTCQPFGVVFPLWMDWIRRLSGGRPIEIVAHNGFRFDFVMLCAEVSRHGLAKDAASMEMLFGRDLGFRAFHDTLIVSRRQSSDIKGHSLLHVWRRALGKGEDEAFEGAHNALGDCRALASIYRSGQLPLNPALSISLPLLIRKCCNPAKEEKKPTHATKPKEPKVNEPLEKKVPTPAPTQMPARMPVPIPVPMLSTSSHTARIPVIADQKEEYDEEESEKRSIVKAISFLQQFRYKPYLADSLHAQI